MSFHFWPFHKPTPLPDTPIRGQHGQFSPSPRTRQMRSRASKVEAQLRDYVNETTPRQRRADFRVYEAVAAALRKVRA